MDEQNFNCRYLRTRDLNNNAKLFPSSFFLLEPRNLKPQKKAIVYLRIYRHLCIYSDVQNNLCPSVLRFDTLPSTIILAVNKNVAIFFSLSLGFLSSRDAFRNRSPSLPLCGHYSLVAGVQGIARIARKKKKKRKEKGTLTAYSERS